MNKRNLLIGFIIGLITAFLSTFLFLEFFTVHGFINSIGALRTHGYLGKFAAIGITLDLIVFFIFLKKNQDIKARGVILATITLTLATIFF